MSFPCQNGVRHELDLRRRSSRSPPAAYVRYPADLWMDFDLCTDLCRVFDSDPRIFGGNNYFFDFFSSFARAVERFVWPRWDGSGTARSRPGSSHGHLPHLPHETSHTRFLLTRHLIRRHMTFGMLAVFDTSTPNVPTYTHHAAILAPLYAILYTLPADDLAILLVRA